MAELLPSWYDVLKLSDILCLVVALIADSRHVVEHVFELYMVNLTNMIRKEEWNNSRHKQAVAIGKHPVYWVGPFFEKLYKESQCSLPGDFHANPYFSIYNVPGPIYLPSRLYFFSNPQTSPQGLEIAQQENTVLPESIMVVTSPGRAITKSLFSTISNISQLQPVTDIWMSGVSCEELTPEEQLILSEKARSLWFDEPCKLPVSFVKRLLHRLSGSVTLQLLRLPGLSLKEIEEDLDELMESLLKSHPEMESEEAAYLSLERLTINLDNNQLSQTFKDKWLTRFKRTTIQLSVDDNRRNTSEELTMEEINWLIQEQVNPKTEEQPLGKTLQEKKTEEQPLGETLQGKKTEDQPLGKVLQWKKTEEQPLGENLQRKKTEEQPLGENLQGKKTEEQPLGETLQG